MTRILLVEDNEMNRDVISRRLISEGYEVTMAIDGEEAISKGHSDKPNLILMDLGLPKIDGWEATRRLKAAVETGQIPIIALSGYAMQEDREKALAAGCDDFCSKPVDFKRLMGMIEALLQRTPPPRETMPTAC